MFLKKIVGFKQLTAGLVFSLLASQAIAAGALAIDGHQGGHYGFAYNVSNLTQAEQKAMKDCGEGCQVVLRFETGCAAFAEDSSGGLKAYGWGTLKTSAESKEHAMAACQMRGGKRCKVLASGCNKS